ncbi:amidase [Rubrimonas cliftonensis]|uniref:Amidase/6-aminohexanoate-cyclic-dimer hydrolase n=1 Tax=Rubrimonas cliftonensis TaxID=89524 RepID=A0A1H4A5D9_9RHOB|nr:amidase [Rubrimonas cliftonensis]SEA31195.1 amidase/6-aminohexanoate-cyclic-dimer hydrolase [Rubrimonas cliftonensis]
MSLSQADYAAHDALGLAALVARGETTATALLDLALARAEAAQARLNCIARLDEGPARAAIAAGPPAGPFCGVPFLLKDLGCEAVDFPSSGGSRLLRWTEWPRDSLLFERLRATGLVTFGRTTAPEGGVGPVTEAQVYGGPTLNPWSLGRTPGGSSGGAGAAVAAGVVPAAHGSDGGGSVRIPASNCGLFGLKPTRARLPDGPYAGEGWAGMAIDGFITRSVRDSAALLDAACGDDPGGPYVAPPLREGFAAAIARPPRRLRVAFTAGRLDGAPIHPDCRAAVEDAARLLESLGHHVEEARPTVDVAGLMDAWTTIVACGTALWVRERCAKRGAPLCDDELEPVSLGAIRLAETRSGADYLEAVEHVHDFGRALAGFFEGRDAFLTATMAEPPAEIGRFAPINPDFRDYRIGPAGILPYSPFAPVYNASGQPAATLPLFWNAEGLPIGVQIATRFGDDETLMALAAELEAARPWFGRRPPLF